VGALIFLQKSLPLFMERTKDRIPMSLVKEMHERAFRKNVSSTPYCMKYCRTHCHCESTKECRYDMKNIITGEEPKPFMILAVAGVCVILLARIIFGK
jgi:hypothetical protein